MLMDQNSSATQRLELIGKEVGTSHVELYYRPTFDQIRHAQYLNGTRTIQQVGCSKCSHSRITVTARTTKETTAKQLL